MFLLYENKIQLKYALIGVIIIFLSFSYVTIGREFGKSNENIFSFPKLTKQIYLYVAPNYANLQEDINRTNFWLGYASTTKFIEFFTFRQIKLPNIDYTLLTITLI